MSDVLLEVNDLKTWFGHGNSAVRAVDGVSFYLNRGETFALLGESGCGKSMTALSIMQLVPRPAGKIIAGEVLLHGKQLLTLPETSMREIRGRRIAMIFQEPMTSLNPVLTIGTQIGETLRRHFRLQGDIKVRVYAALNAVGIPDPERCYREYPHQLSGGMKQRVMIAMALACQPDLLIADEPTTALDVTIQAQVLALLKQLQNDIGMAILLITHDLGVVADMADRVAVMYAGQLVEQASQSCFYTNAKHPYSKKLFAALPSMAKRNRKLEVISGFVPTLNQIFAGCRFEQRCDQAIAICKTKPPLWNDHGYEHSSRCHLSAITESTISKTQLTENIDNVATDDDNDQSHNDEMQRPLLLVNNLTIEFPITAGILKRTTGYVHAVDNVSLSLCKGKTLALVGESGCGKTTVAKGILQLLPSTSGTVEFDNINLTALRGESLRRKRCDFQIVFQDPFSSMNPRMMVAELVAEGMTSQKICGSRAQRHERVKYLLQQVGLPPDILYRYPHEFSGGQRQRLCIARALAVNPRLIVCDEPTSALDVSVQAQILNLLKTLQLELGLTYLFITHNLSVVAYLAHEIAVMYLGRIVEQGLVDEVLNQPAHPYTQALLSAIPTLEHDNKREIIRVQGDIPSPINRPSGCFFHPRCRQVMPECRIHYPPVSARSDTHAVSCFLK